MAGRCVTFVERGRAAITPCEPEDPGPGQVLVRAEATLISPGTERACLLQLPNTRARPPYVGGDCFVGTVERVGADVSTLSTGQRVFAELRHKEFQLAEAADLFPVPDGVPSEEACFTGLLQTALQAVRKARAEIGTPVLLVGLGLIGQLACKLARLDGAVPLLGADLSPFRREIASATCDHVLDPRAPGFAEELLALTGGLGPEVVIEATGFPEVIKESFRMAARMGRVILLGSTRGETESINFYSDVHKRGLTIIGAHCSAVPPGERQPGLWPRHQDEPLCLELLSRGRISMADLITDRYPVARAPEAYARLAGWDDRIMGTILEWR